MRLINFLVKCLNLNNNKKRNSILILSILIKVKTPRCCHDAQSYGLSFFVGEVHLLIKYFKNFSQTHTFLKMRDSGTQDFDR